MRLEKPITLRCENCKKCFDVELDFDCVSTDERDMGLSMTMKEYMMANVLNVERIYTFR